jgi:hypothetical protein
MADQGVALKAQRAALADRAFLLSRWESEGVVVPDCPGCRSRYEAADPRAVFAPWHKPSQRCESGKQPHCACAACF